MERNVVEERKQRCRELLEQGLKDIEEVSNEKSRPDGRYVWFDMASFIADLSGAIDDVRRCAEDNAVPF